MTITLGPGEVCGLGAQSGPLLIDAHGTPESPVLIRPAAGRSTVSGDGHLLPD